MALTDNIQLSIVLPAYEEAANLEQLLPRLAKMAGTMVTRFEILAVDTPEPRDATPDVCRKHGARYVPRRGGSLYGHAIRTALQEARGEWIIFMDADGSHNPDFMPELWKYRDTFDLIIASRYVRGGKTENPAVLIFLSLVINVIFRVTLGLKCADVSNSFRLYRGDDLRKLHLKCNHFDIVEEILVKLITLHPGYRIKEVPFFFEKRKAGKTKRNLVTFALGYFVTLIRLMKLKSDAKKNQG